MLRSMLQQITEELQIKHEKPGNKKNEDLVQIKVIITSHDFSPDYTTTLAQITRITPSEYTLKILY